MAKEIPICTQFALLSCVYFSGKQSLQVLLVTCFLANVKIREYIGPTFLHLSFMSASSTIYLITSIGRVPGNGVCGTVVELCSWFAVDDAGNSACVQMILLRSSAISASCFSSFLASLPSCRSAWSALCCISVNSRLTASRRVL